MNLSVIIVTWNCWPHVQRCLESLRPALDGLVSEIIIVDNGSADDTPALLRARYPDVRVIEMGHNAGFAAAANRGIREAHGRFIWLLNPDTILQPSTARALMACLEQHPRAGVAGPRILQPDGITDPLSARQYPTLASELLEKLGLRRLSMRCTRLRLHWAECRPVPLISGASMCLRKEALDEVGSLDESFFLYAEDMDLCRRLQAAGWEVLYCGCAELTHLRAGSSAGRPDEAGIEAILSMAKYFHKYHGPFVARVYRGCLLLLCAIKWALFAAGSFLAPSREMRQGARRKVNLHRRLIAALIRGRQP